MAMPTLLDSPKRPTALLQRAARFGPPHLKSDRRRADVESVETRGGTAAVSRTFCEGESNSDD